jgi:energy-coupling factor transporter ATP-binding protein EcfA2
LSRVGLNDAYLFVKRFKELSDGQKYRYKLAKLIESKAQFWIADEFCSTLDRDTAKIVAFNAQKIARKEKKALIVATCDRDLFEDLKPNVYIVKEFGQEVRVYYFNSQAPKECSLVKEMRIVEGTVEDYRKLCHFHYRSSNLVAPKKIFALKRNGETVGVIVYARSPAICFGRPKYFRRLVKIKEINEKLLMITRVIVHPKYRTIGLGVKLVKETLPLAGSPYVEMVAVMAKYNPFAEKAGMKKIAEKIPDKRLVQVKSLLESYGFSQPLLNSVEYNFNKLQSLKENQIRKIREALVECHHFFLRKNIIGEKEHYSKKDEKSKWKLYDKKIRSMSLKKLAKILSVIARLTQVKVYLVWCKNDRS